MPSGLSWGTEAFELGPNCRNTARACRFLRTCGSSATMPHAAVWNSHPDGYGKGSRRWCGSSHPFCRGPALPASHLTRGLRDASDLYALNDLVVYLSVKHSVQSRVREPVGHCPQVWPQHLPAVLPRARQRHWLPKGVNTSYCCDCWCRKVDTAGHVSCTPAALWDSHSGGLRHPTAGGLSRLRGGQLQSETDGGAGSAVCGCS